IHVCNAKRDWRTLPRLRDIFSDKGFYYLTVAIGGEDARGETFHFAFEWTGNWQTSFLRFPSEDERKASSEPSLYQHILKETSAIYEKSAEQDRIRDEENQRIRQQVLEKAAELLNETPRSFIADFNALPLANAHHLKSNPDLVWICDKLADGGHSNPLKELGEWVPEEDWLDFIKWVTIRANTNAKNGFSYVRAAEEWPKRKGYPEPTQRLPMDLLVLSYEGTF